MASILTVTWFGAGESTSISSIAQSSPTPCETPALHFISDPPIVTVRQSGANHSSEHTTAR